MSTHSHHHDPHAIPRAPIVAAAALVLVTLLTVAGARWAGLATNSSARTGEPVTAVVEAFFDDRDDGAVVVREAGSGRVLTVAEPGSGGFLRGTLRALVRERRQHGLGAEQPFRVLAHPDGRLTLEDPATGRRMDLSAFGPSNVAVFARLLPTGSAAR
jgi:putative photosynthetic complex assembly protein